MFFFLFGQCLHLHSLLLPLLLFHISKQTRSHWDFAVSFLWFAFVACWWVHCPASPTHARSWYYAPLRTLSLLSHPWLCISSKQRAPGRSRHMRFQLFLELGQSSDSDNQAEFSFCALLSPMLARENRCSPPFRPHVRACIHSQGKTGKTQSNTRKSILSQSLPLVG